MYIYIYICPGPDEARAHTVPCPIVLCFSSEAKDLNNEEDAYGAVPVTAHASPREATVHKALARAEAHMCVCVCVCVCVCICM